MRSQFKKKESQKTIYKKKMVKHYQIYRPTSLEAPQDRQVVQNCQKSQKISQTKEEKKSLGLWTMLARNWRKNPWNRPWESRRRVPKLPRRPGPQKHQSDLPENAEDRGGVVCSSTGRTNLAVCSAGDRYGILFPYLQQEHSRGDDNHTFRTSGGLDGCHKYICDISIFGDDLQFLNLQIHFCDQMSNLPIHLFSVSTKKT